MEPADEHVDAVPPPPLPPPVDGVPDHRVRDGRVAGDEPDRALLHDTEQTRTYPCRQCGGELEFDIGEQRLKCPHCGNVQDILDDASRLVAEQDLQAALAALDAGATERTGHQLADEKEVVCQNCGGHTTFTGSLTATRCPYCATPVQRDDVHDAPARLAVDGVLPFQVDERTATEQIESWINSRWFAPNEFKKYSTTGSFRSVYSAYFTYDAQTTARYTGRRGDHYTVTVGSGDNRRTEVRVRWSYAAGTIHSTFDDVPVCANDGLDPGHVQALEPWPTHDARPFTGEYMAGHLARTYDHGVSECFGTAKARMEAAISDDVRRDIGGDQQQITSLAVQYRDLTYKHLLLPIWLLTVVYANRPFQVFINGVTGEVQGQRPYSAVKIALAVFVALVVAGILFVLSQGSAGGPVR